MAWRLIVGYMVGSIAAAALVLVWRRRLPGAEGDMALVHCLRSHGVVLLLILYWVLCLAGAKLLTGR